MVKSKKCTICKIIKHLDEFNKKLLTKDGLQSHCRDCNRARSRRYYAENSDKHKKAVAVHKGFSRQKIREYLAEYLLTHPCVDCGETDILVLEFDHVRGSKRANLSSMGSSGFCLETVQEEISKCNVRCANCHRRKTAKDQKWYKMVFKKFIDSQAV